MVEGVRVEQEAVLGANVVLTASTPIIDVTGEEPVEMRGAVPAARVVIPGTRTKKFPAGELPAAVRADHRRAHARRPTARPRSTAALREHAVSVCELAAVDRHGPAAEVDVEVLATSTSSSPPSSSTVTGESPPRNT